MQPGRLAGAQAAGRQPAEGAGWCVSVRPSAGVATLRLPATQDANPKSTEDWVTEVEGRR